MCSKSGSQGRTTAPLFWAALACLSLAGQLVADARAQAQSPLERIEAIGLESASIGRVTAHFAAADRQHAEQLARLSEQSAAYFERELGLAFPLQLAVLAPQHWFDPYAGGDAPYGMPWGWVQESLMTAPASLDEGVLIVGPDNDSNLRRVRFVLLHEFGHLASKQYLHPDGPRLYSSVRWFEELLATYFAYAFVSANDPQWAQASRVEWAAFVEGYTPAVVSLDWSFMRKLPPAEFARSYAWYQNLLNLRAAALYEQHGLDLLRRLRDELPWEKSGEWTSDTLLPRLERIAPGSQAWADELPQANPTR